MENEIEKEGSGIWKDSLSVDIVEMRLDGGLDGAPGLITGLEGRGLRGIYEAIPVTMALQQMVTKLTGLKE